MVAIAGATLGGLCTQTTSVKGLTSTASTAPQNLARCTRLSSRFSDNPGASDLSCALHSEILCSNHGLATSTPSTAGRGLMRGEGRLRGDDCIVKRFQPLLNKASYNETSCSHLGFWGIRTYAVRKALGIRSLARIVGSGSSHYPPWVTP